MKLSDGVKAASKFNDAEAVFILINHDNFFENMFKITTKSCSHQSQHCQTDSCRSIGTTIENQKEKKDKITTS